MQATTTHQFINELSSGQRLEDQVFLIKSKDLRTTTQGNLYIHAVLADRTGQILARQWQATEDGFRAMPEGGFLRFKGRVESYKGNPQFIIDAVRPAEADSFDLADFLAVTPNDPEQMWPRVVEILKEVEHPDLSLLLDEFLADEQLMAAFRKAPAAAVMHHAYIGGLLEHTLNLMELALRIAPLFPRLSKDLMVAGLFLHDIGKTAELTYETSFGYSDEGQLLGHLVLCTMWIQQKADAASKKAGKPIDAKVVAILQHIILSHHGRYEFGSPKLPAIPEAIAIHYLDNLDAKVHMFLADIDGDADPATSWTNYNRALETKVFTPDIMGARSGQ